MNALKPRRTALAALVLLPLLSCASAAQTAAGFEDIGFQDVRDRAASADMPAAAPAVVASASVGDGGVFLQSALDGSLDYCSAAGCRLLRNTGVDDAVLAAPGALYFTGRAGAGYCTARRCDLLLPGVSLTFAVSVGPKGDIYGSDDADQAGWHCTPDACRQASGVALQRYSKWRFLAPGSDPRDDNFLRNSIPGVYTPSGDFISSGDEGLFLCANGLCKRISDGRIDPARLSTVAALAKKGEQERSSYSALDGADGATYRIVSRAADAEPKESPETAQRLYGAVTREIGGRSSALTFDAPISCWQWTDDDQDPPAWGNACRLVR